MEKQTNFDKKGEEATKKRVKKCVKNDFIIK